MRHSSMHGESQKVWTQPCQLLVQSEAPISPVIKRKQQNKILGDCITFQTKHIYVVFIQVSITHEGLRVS